MKTLYLLLAAGFINTSCTSSPQEEAKAAVSRYVKENLNDPSSYEAMGFDLQPYTLADSAQVAADLVLAELGASGDKVAQNLLSDENPLIIQEGKKLAAEHERLSEITDTARVGWRVAHEYRAKNTYGALMKQQGTFIVYPPDRVMPVVE